MYAFIQDVPIKEDVYAKIKERIGTAAPEGQVAHIVLRREDGLLRYISIWRDKAACDAAFVKHIHPAVSAVFREIGFRPAGEPRREEVAVVDAWIGQG